MGLNQGLPDYESGGGVFFNFFDEKKRREGALIGLCTVSVDNDGYAEWCGKCGTGQLTEPLDCRTSGSHCVMSRFR